MIIKPMTVYDDVETEIARVTSLKNPLESKVKSYIKNINELKKLKLGMSQTGRREYNVIPKSTQYPYPDLTETEIASLLDTLKTDTDKI